MLVYSERENKLPSHRPDSKLLGTGQKSRKNKARRGDPEHGELSLTKQTKHRRVWMKTQKQTHKFGMCYIPNHAFISTARTEAGPLFLS